MSESELKSTFFRLATNIISRATGKIAQTSWSPGVDQFLIEQFIRAYKINASEAELLVSQYSTLDAFFTRKLRPELRPIGQEPVHPCDGQLARIQTVEGDTVLQIKSIEYSVAELLGGANMSGPIDFALSYYLSPQDCHRVYAPMDAEVLAVEHLPGTLWPVNKWGLRNIEGVFAKNERVVFVLRSKIVGVFYLVMVGALNVGQIEVSFDPRIMTNQPDISEPRTFDYDPPIQLRCGQELGIFHLGSSVILLLPKGAQDFFSVQTGAVKLGHPFFES